ncbi:NAD(P)-binding protein [Thozetella sp. PMI_491]|nr:NAD(P)-binding protein [Thozetella sp. PMI_491]
MFSKNHFQVQGALAQKGANVVIVARGEQRLLEGVQRIQKASSNPESQRFHHISADLSNASEAVRVVNEVVSWNLGNPPDMVWCCAGSSHPSLFIDTPVSELKSQVDSNYFTSLYMAHATLNCWLQAPKTDTTTQSKESSSAQATPAQPRHIIFTASVLAFYSFAGYSPYSPCKAALRSLCDSLSQEMNLYAAAYPKLPRVRVHTVFPAGILGEAFDLENEIKSDVTKMLEEGDEPQAPEVIARKSIKALESGQELITTDFIGGLLRRSMLGGSVRGGVWRALLDWFMGGLLAIIMVFVRDDMDKKVRKWGHNHGASGMKGGRRQA